MPMQPQLLSKDTQPGFMMRQALESEPMPAGTKPYENPAPGTEQKFMPENAPVNTGTEDGAAPGSSGPSLEEMESYFNSLPEPAMAYLAEHMTPEIINVIRIVSGQEVGDYLNQFVDNDKVLVPVPRQMAEQYRQQGMAQSQPQQGPAPTPQPQAQSAQRPQGMMAPAV
jgi:hypothetical protein